MPNDTVKSFAKKSGKSVKEVEKLWTQAEEIAKKEYKDVKKGSTAYYKIVTGILKKSCSLSDKDFEEELKEIIRDIIEETECFNWRVHNLKTDEKLDIVSDSYEKLIKKYPSPDWVVFCNEDETEYMISKSGSKAHPTYMIMSTDGTDVIDMFFDSTDDAIKYANKKELKLI